LLTAAAGLISLFLMSKVKYEQRMPAQKPFDVVGSVLLFLAVILITVGIMQAGDAGLTSPSVLLFVGAGLVIGAILVVTSLRKENPLVQFRLFQIGTVAIGIFINFIRFLPNVLLGAFVARFVQQALGLSPTVTGMLMILPVLSQVVVAPIGGKMLDQVGPRKPVALGVALLAAGVVVLAFAFQAQSLWLVLLATIIGGAGFSFTNPVQMAALSATPLEQRGMLAGLLPLASNFGTALSVALLTAGMTAFMNSYLVSNPGATEAAALSSALSTLAWISLLATLVTLFVAFKLPKSGAVQAAPAPAKAGAD
jgi:MFS family permease